MDAKANKGRRRTVPLPLQMLIGLVVGLAIGILWPSFGAALQPLGTAFIEAIRMIVIPLVFSAVTLGIYKMGSDVRLLGKGRYRRLRLVLLCHFLVCRHRSRPRRHLPAGARA